MPRNSSGTMSGANGPYISGTVISSAAVNARLADIETEITDSLSRSGKGGMGAPLRTPDGTVAAPAHSFTAETGSGWYRAAAGDLRLAIAGVDLLSFKNNVLTLMIAGNPIFQAGGANSALSIVGNKDAADTGTDTSISSSATRTAGDLLQIQNHGSLSLGGLGVDFHGLLRLGAQAAAIQPASIWTAITLTAGWTSTLGMSYLKDACGFVHIKGSATAGAGSPFTLPAGFRSLASKMFVIEDNGTGFVSVSINPAGDVTFRTGGPAAGHFYIFDPVTFLAEQ